MILNIVRSVCATTAITQNATIINARIAMDCVKNTVIHIIKIWRYKVNKEKALNIARGCVLGSGLSQSEKAEVIDCLNEINTDVTYIVDGMCLDCGQEKAEDWDYCPGCGKRLMS